MSFSFHYPVLSILSMYMNLVFILIIFLPSLDCIISCFNFSSNVWTNCLLNSDPFVKPKWLYKSVIPAGSIVIIISKPLNILRVLEQFNYWQRNKCVALIFNSDMQLDGKIEFRKNILWSLMDQSLLQFPDLCISRGEGRKWYLRLTGRATREH